MRLDAIMRSDSIQDPNTEIRQQTELKNTPKDKKNRNLYTSEIRNKPIQKESER